jgi:hypothetical protein
MRYLRPFIFLLAALLVTLVSTLFSQGIAGPRGYAKNAPPAIKLTLKAQHDVVQSGSPIKLIVTLTNISGHVFTYVRQAVVDHGGFDYKFEIHDEKGAAPPDIKFRRARKGREDPAELTPETPMRGSLAYMQLQLSQSLTDTVNISRLHDLRRPGKYNISATAFDNASGTFVKSNTITVTVTE